MATKPTVDTCAGWSQKPDTIKLHPTDASFLDPQEIQQISLPMPSSISRCEVRQRIGYIGHYENRRVLSWQSSLHHGRSKGLRPTSLQLRRSTVARSRNTRRSSSTVVSTSTWQSSATSSLSMRWATVTPMPLSVGRSRVTWQLPDGARPQVKLSSSASTMWFSGKVRRYPHGASVARVTHRALSHTARRRRASAHSRRSSCAGHDLEFVE